MTLKKFEEKKDFEPRSPDFKGRLDVVAWKKIDKNGNEYLTVKIGSIVNLFPYIKKDNHD